MNGLLCVNCVIMIFKVVNEVISVGYLFSFPPTLLFIVFTKEDDFSRVFSMFGMIMMVMICVMIMAMLCYSVVVTDSVQVITGPNWAVAQCYSCTDHQAGQSHFLQ